MQLPRDRWGVLVMFQGQTKHLGSLHCLVGRKACHHQLQLIVLLQLRMIHNCCVGFAQAQSYLTVLG